MRQPKAQDWLRNHGGQSCRELQQVVSALARRAVALRSEDARLQDELVLVQHQRAEEQRRRREGLDFGQALPMRDFMAQRRNSEDPVLQAEGPSIVASFGLGSQRLGEASDDSALKAAVDDAALQDVVRPVRARPPPLKLTGTTATPVMTGRGGSSVDSVVDDVALENLISGPSR